MNHSPEMTVAIRAAKSAGAFLKKHFYDRKKVDEASQNDIKLELDKLSQKLITGGNPLRFPYSRCTGGGRLHRRPERRKRMDRGPH